MRVAPLLSPGHHTQHPGVSADSHMAWNPHAEQFVTAAGLWNGGVLGWNGGVGLTAAQLGSVAPAWHLTKAVKPSISGQNAL